MTRVYATFEDLVEYAKAEGAQYMTMGNYHSGGFWKTEVTHQEESTDPKEICAREIMGRVLDDPDWWRHIKTHYLMHFQDSANLFNYLDWTTTDWLQTWDMVDPASLKVIPIDQAVEWYKGWNKGYEETRDNATWYRPAFPG